MPAHGLGMPLGLPVVDVGDGVSDTRARSRASSAVSARCASCSPETSSSVRSCCRRPETWLRRLSTNDLGMRASLRGGAAHSPVALRTVRGETRAVSSVEPG